MKAKELPLISFVMPVYGDQDTVGDAVHSIVDQDYPNIEIILSVDGCDKSAKAVKSIVKKYRDHKVSVSAIYAKENQGACIARNDAAKLAEGKFISFLPADAKLFPGVVRIWINTLEDNPDYDFMYGGYRFLDQILSKKDVKELAEEANMSLDEYTAYAGYVKRSDGSYNGAKGFDYLSEPFDPYFLDQHNYIDGSFPLKREMFEKIGGWDPKIKSLQDWDLWLQVVKAGGKGVFVRDIFFDTEYPHRGGLSHDSSRHWIKRVRQIQKKHGIKENKICVTSLGAPFHGKRTSRLLDADYKQMPSFKPHMYEAVYLLGFFPTLADQCGQVFNNCKGKRIIHWIGTDIWQMQQMDLFHRRVLLDFFEKNIDYHLCEADFTKKELKELGIDAKVVPIPPRWLYKPLPMPEKFTVAVYQPQNNKGFYLPDLCKEVAKLCPEIDFIFFGDDSYTGRLNNVQYRGYVNDMDKLIEQCSAIMRLTIHDGLPLGVLEFITAGRHALVNLPIKHVMQTKVADPKIIAKGLKKLSELPPNLEGSKYWRSKLSHKKFKNTIEKLVKYDPKEYWENRADTWIEQSDANYSLPEKDEKIIKKWLKDIEFDSVLDIGCGSGRMVEWFERKNYTGIDISEKLCSYASKTYPDKAFYCKKVEDIGELGNDHDLIFSYTTLEHITKETWQKAVEAIKRHGKIALIIEPVEFESIAHCHTHDYEKDFHVIKKKKLSDKTMYLVDLTK
tara:strand:+ start:7765 stop:9951 length:2187 start_codon:yes stop_codon:yes gene_type:complete